ncbi:Hypothetical protein FKW44_013235, partial [Caligus rogercresseyi]
PGMISKLVKKARVVVGSSPNTYQVTHLCRFFRRSNSNTGINTYSERRNSALELLIISSLWALDTIHLKMIFCPKRLGNLLLGLGQGPVLLAAAGAVHSEDFLD